MSPFRPLLSALGLLLAPALLPADFVLRENFPFEGRIFYYHAQEGPPEHSQWHYFPRPQRPENWQERITIHHFPRLERPREMVMEVIARLRQSYPDFSHGILPGAQADQAGLFFTRPGARGEALHFFSYARRPPVKGLIAVEYATQPPPPGLRTAGRPPEALLREFEKLLAGRIVQEDLPPPASPAATPPPASGPLTVRVYRTEPEAARPAVETRPPGPVPAATRPVAARSRTPPIVVNPSAPSRRQYPAPLTPGNIRPVPLRPEPDSPLNRPPLLPSSGLSRTNAAQFLPPPPLLPVIKPLQIEPIVDGQRIVIDPRFAHEFSTAVPRVDFAFFVPPDIADLYVEYQSEDRPELLRISQATPERDLIANLRFYDQPIPAGPQEVRLAWAMDFLREEVVTEALSDAQNPRLTDLILTKVGPRDAVLAAASFTTGGQEFLARFMLLVPPEGAGVLAFSQINRYLSGIESPSSAIENGLMARIAHSTRLLRDLEADPSFPHEP